MISIETREKYLVTIGIECHVQLKTKTKLFSSAGNDAREAPPNTLVNHIDFGLPGGLPVLNKEALRLASKAGFALNSRPQNFSKFDRKHYFYPDLPMGYQITQYDEPIILGGSVDIVVDGQPKTIGITRAHLEADAGKSTHPAGKDYSLVDLNRAGTPLLEIVSEPDMHSAAEAKTYAHELYLRMRYAEVSDCNLYYGNMRFDVNVSVSQTAELGTRTETKNINSFRAVEKTVEFEVGRQIEQLEKGAQIVQETRGWDDAKQKTFSQRTKENADDYRYMPDPDIPPVVLADSYIEQIEGTMPIMPDTWRRRLLKLGLDRARIDILLEEDIESNLGYLQRIADIAAADQAAGSFSANYLINRDITARQSHRAEHDGVKSESIGKLPTTKQLSDVYAMYKADKLSSNAVDELLWELSLAADDTVVAETYATEHNYLQVSDESEITAIVTQVLTDNPQAAADVRNGEMKAIGFLVGQVMKASKGKANPSLAQSVIKKQLNI